MENDAILGRFGSAFLSLPSVFFPRTLPQSYDTLPIPTIGEKLRLSFQRTVGRAFLLPFGGMLIFLMRYVRGYRIEGLAELRRNFREIARDDRPLLICANHLTFIDSALIIWALAPNPWYLLHFRFFSWNLPAGDFFKKKLVFRIVAYLSKCIFIHRDGTREHKNSVLGACSYLLRKGDIVSIFPEGRRSRAGRFDVDHITFGVGKILAATPHCRVLCLYLRGDKQEKYSNYPPRRSRFRVLMKTITPSSSMRGRRAYFEMTSQISAVIKGLEDEYFTAK